MINHEDLPEVNGSPRKCYIWRLRDMESEVTVHAHWDGMGYAVRGIRAKAAGLAPLFYQEWGVDELPCDESL